MRIFIGVLCHLDLLIWIFLIDFSHGAELVEVFRDDFNGSVLDLSKWNAANVSSTVNNELEFYTPDAVTLKGGFLDIQSRKQQYSGRNYTSGRVDTQNKYDFQYGEIEWRARLPKGKGLWTALWIEDPRCDPAVPCDLYWPPAVSIIDFRGDLPNKVQSTAAFRNAAGAVDYAYAFNESLPDLTAGFHVYRMTWSKDLLVSYVDTLELLRVTDSTKIPQTRMQIVMNVAVGGDFGGQPDATTVFPADFLIDYVVVRQNSSMVGYRSPITSKIPGFVGPLVGGLLGFFLLLGIAIFSFIRVKKRKLRWGTMHRGSTWDSTTTLSSLLYMKTGNIPLDMLLKKYVNLIEIPAENLQLSDKVLGKGQFGIVYKGVARGLRGQTKPVTVAVKMLISINLDPDEQRQLGEEIRVMTKLGRHLNVVNLLGIVVKGNPMLILEYCQYGSLLTYLKMHRGVYFYDHVDRNGQLLPYDELEEMKIAADARNVSGRRASFPEEIFDDQVMSTRDLISFAYQITRGMEYLVSRLVIHRDLAARNVLVSERKIVKISDFGMARQRQTVYVLENDKASLPVKWMPPEAIVSRTFSQKSDIWSYGVLLSEIFTLGDMPYIGSKVSNSVNEFVVWLAEGHQMDRPAAAPVEIYEIQKRCWQLNRDERPTFAEVREELDKLITDDLNDSYLALDEPYQQFNKLNEDLLNRVASAEEQYLTTLDKDSNESENTKFSNGNLYVTPFLAS